MLDNLFFLVLNFQEGWCDSRGTLEDVKVKIQMKQDGAVKRERALAYSLAQKVLSGLQNCIFFISPFLLLEVLFIFNSFW